MDIDGARAAGVTQILVHERELQGEADTLIDELKAEGCTVRARQDGLVLLELPPQK